MVPKRALIIKIAAIGDVIMALPSVRLLYEKGFKIDWVCGRAVFPLLSCYSWITPILVNDKAILVGTLSERVRNIAQLWWRLAPTRYDLCATLYYDRRYRFLTLPVRAQRKFMLTGRSRKATLIAGRHHTDEYVRMLLETEDSCREVSTAPVRPDRLPPYRWHDSGASRRIAIFPGGTSNVLSEQVLRRWPVKNYVLLAQALLDRKWEVVLLGGPEDAWVSPYFEQLTVTDCIGALSLPEVISACDACDAVVTHDTGPLHLAGLSEACLVGVFGPTDPATRVPRRPYAVGIWGGQSFACRPCYDGRNFAPCRFNGCMHQVAPEVVIRELDYLLEARSLGISKPWHIVFSD